MYAQLRLCIGYDSDGTSGTKRPDDECIIGQTHQQFVGHSSVSSRPKSTRPRDMAVRRCTAADADEVAALCARSKVLRTVNVTRGRLLVNCSML